MMRGFTASDGAVGMEFKVRSFMCGDLQNHKRKAEFENALQRYQTPEGVVVALFRGAQVMNNKQDHAHAAEALYDASQDGEGDRSIQSNVVRKLVSQDFSNDQPYTAWGLWCSRCL